MAKIRIKRTEANKTNPQLLPGELGLIKTRLYYGPKEVESDSSLVDALPIASLDTDNTWIGENTFVGDVTINGGNVAPLSDLPDRVRVTQNSTTLIRLRLERDNTLLGTETTIPSANTSFAGLMSSADKGKLNGIAAGAQINVLEGVQADGVDLSITNKKVNITKTNIGLGNVKKR